MSYTVGGPAGYSLGGSGYQGSGFSVPGSVRPGTIPVGPDGAIGCARGAREQGVYMIRNARTGELIRENVSYAEMADNRIEMAPWDDTRCDGPARSQTALTDLPRRTIIRQYPAASLPVEAYLPTPPPEPALVAEPTMMPEPPPVGPANGFTFLSAEVDATRSKAAADAVAHGEITGDNIVRGLFNGRYRGFVGGPG